MPKRVSKSGDFKKGHTPWNKDKLWSEEVKKKLRKPKSSTINMFHKGFLGKHHSKETIEKMGISKSAEHRVKIGNGNRGKIRSKEAIENMRKETLRRWQDPEYVRRWFLANHIKPNEPERFLSNLLQQFLPNEYKYVGNGEFILAGKCPDFMNINGKKKIIELYGDYWHKGQNPQARIGLFAEYGYSTLIVWEHDLKDSKSMVNKLLEFNGVSTLEV